MAKEQGLSLNPTKISGTCGRLMCCLKYEQDTYEHLLRVTPKVGAIVKTPDGKGTVVENNLITGILKVQLERRPEAAPLTIHRHQVELLKDAKIRIEKEEFEALKGIE
jgi:cell fate regulator YaaT (PSP1 superfamily)